LQNSPLESGCVVVALIENYSTSKPSKDSPEKSQILSCDTVVVVTLLSQMTDIFIQDKAACFGYKRTVIIRPELPDTKEFNFIINSLHYTYFFKMFNVLYLGTIL
jgi:hypothetical protein